METNTNTKIEIWTEFQDNEWQKWLIVSENVFIENTKITIEDALKEEKSSKYLYRFMQILAN